MNQEKTFSPGPRWWPAVVILALDRDDNVLFVRQYRYPTGRVLLELPAGTLDPREDPLDCAARGS